MRNLTLTIYRRISGNYLPSQSWPKRANGRFTLTWWPLWPSAYESFFLASHKANEPLRFVTRCRIIPVDYIINLTSKTILLRNGTPVTWRRCGAGKEKMSIYAHCTSTTCIQEHRALCPFVYAGDANDAQGLCSQKSPGDFHRSGQRGGCESVLKQGSLSASCGVPSGYQRSTVCMSGLHS